MNRYLKKIVQLINGQLNRKVRKNKVFCIGMPVISTTHCDIPSEVVHGKTGLLSAETEIPALTGHILRFFYMGQEEYDAFGRNAREHVRTNFDIERNARALTAFYRKILK